MPPDIGGDDDAEGEGLHVDDDLDDRAAGVAARRDVVDAVFEIKEDIHTAEVDAHAAFSTALDNDLDPKGKADRRAKKDASRAEYKKEQTKTKAADRAQPDAPKSEQARWDAARAECRLNLDYEKVSHWPDSGRRAIYDVEKTIQQFAKSAV